MRLLIKEAHAAAVLRGKTTHPLPQAMVFTQPATEADDAVDPERLEVVIPTMPSSTISPIDEGCQWITCSTWLYAPR